MHTELIELGISLIIWLLFSSLLVERNWEAVVALKCVKESRTAFSRIPFPGCPVRVGHKRDPWRRFGVGEGIISHLVTYTHCHLYAGSTSWHEAEAATEPAIAPPSPGPSSFSNSWARCVCGLVLWQKAPDSARHLHHITKVRSKKNWHGFRSVLMSSSLRLCVSVSSSSALWTSSSRVRYEFR